MTETKSEYRCETCAFFIGKMENFFKVDQPFCKNPKMIEYFKSLPKDPSVSEDGKHSWLPQDVIRKGDLWFAPLSHSDIERNSVLGCLGHSAMIEQKPSYQDLIDHIRWTQNLWRHGIEIMRKNNLVIASNTPMEKLAFTFYSDLCEIDSRALHLFGEGPGDESYKDQSAIRAREIAPYPRPYEEEIKRTAREDERNKALPIIDHAEVLCKEIGNTGDWQSKIGFNALQILNQIAKYKSISLTDIIHKSEE